MSSECRKVRGLYLPTKIQYISRQLCSAQNCCRSVVGAVSEMAVDHPLRLTIRTHVHTSSSWLGQPIFPATTKPLARAARSFLCPARNEEKSEEEAEEEEQREKG